MAAWVHVVGTGTIGEPLIGSLTRHRKELGIDRVTFSKNRPTPEDVGKIARLVADGAELCVMPFVEVSGIDITVSGPQAFEAAGYPKPAMLTPEAIRGASVIVDCTSEGHGLTHRQEWYEAELTRPTFRGAIAQGSEFGFGKPYAYHINERALVPGRDRFLQVVSCNTHCIAAVLKAVAGDRLERLTRAHATCIRRASDVSQKGGMIAGLEVGKHDDPAFGTHHARDAYHLFATLFTSARERDDALGSPEHPRICSTALRAPTQYMHVIVLAMTIQEYLSREDVIERLRASPTIAYTEFKDAARIFAFGRDHGFHGRIFNQAVVNPATIWASPWRMARPYAGTSDTTEVVVEAFTPQDGNSLLSSLAAVAWLLDPELYEQRISCLRPYLFGRI